MPVSTKFRKVDYNPSGDSFISSSKFISSQYSKNLMVVPTPNALSEPGYLASFPGLKLWSTGVTLEADRGIHQYLFQSKGWKVSGGKLYSFTSSGVQTEVGLIPGTELCDIRANATTLLICNGNGLFTCDGSSVSVLSPGFTAVSLDYINNQFVVSDSNNVIRISDVGSTNFTAENTFLAESQQDAMVGVRIFNQFLLNFGVDTIEPWENVGVGNPPFARLNGAIIEDTGLANRLATTNTKSSIYFLGANKIPYRLINFQSDNLSKDNPGISELFGSYKADNAFLSSVTVYGQDIILFNFPSNNKVWCYSETTGLWFEVNHDVDNKLWLGKTSAYLFNKTLVGDRLNGNIYELDYNTYKNNDVTMVRERVFRPMSGELLSSPRDYFQMKMVQFCLETGVGVNDDNPQMMVSYSTDGGNTYSNERFLYVGEAGEYMKYIEDYSNKKFTDLTVKVRYTENTRFALGAASIYVRQSGK